MSTREVGSKAENLLRHPVAPGITVGLPAGRLEVWRSARRRPARTVTYYVAADGTSFPVSTSWSSFETMLRAARPPLEDTALIAKIIGLGPGRRMVVDSEELAPEDRGGQWTVPAVGIDGAWVGFCYETAEGRWERVKVRPDYEVVVEDLGEAPKIKLR